jgi:hypothetical protein
VGHPVHGEEKLTEKAGRAPSDKGSARRNHIQNLCIKMGTYGVVLGYLWVTYEKILVSDWGVLVPVKRM